jgi:hypothetical protein
MTTYLKNTLTGEVFSTDNAKNYFGTSNQTSDGKPIYERVKKADFDKAEKERTTKFLLSVLKPGTTVNTVLRHVSKSGMSRSISLFVADKNEMVDITYHAVHLMGDKIDYAHGGIKIGGCGMDMGFQLVYSLGMALWPKGTKQAHGTRNGEKDYNGGYALKQRWF